VLDDLATIAFVPSRDLPRTRVFYGGTLGLPFVSEDGFALVFQAADRLLRVVAAGDFTPQPFTILGWGEFLRYPHFEQDERGIWTAPSGDPVAWFNDPDGNVLSLSSHVDA